MLNRPAGGDSRPPKKYYSARKKYCHFCKDRVNLVDYKNYKNLENYIAETGKILPARVSGTCAYHQKQLSKAIKRARHMALIKYIVNKRG
ncbi:MAG TPA: 30S ribosomal protein S18 [Candidatus Aminicenantes bacterium]|nr:30S ribosomal protein S18 [Candidatus Aminicenantes bacterium]